MSWPMRIQLSRARGWRMPANTVKVDRSTRWGNPYRIGEPVDRPLVRRWGWLFNDYGFVAPDAETAVRRFATCIALDEAIHPYVRQHLGGKNLACWCGLCPVHQAGKPFALHCRDCAPCHCEPLGRLANEQARP